MTRPTTKCRREHCGKPLEQHATDDELCPGGSGSTFKRERLGRRGQSNSFRHDEIDVAAKVLACVQRGGDASALVKLPAYARLATKVLRMSAVSKRRRAERETKGA